MTNRVACLVAIALSVMVGIACAQEFTQETHITIQGSSQDVHDYQVRVVVPYEEEMQDDFEDLRFFAADGSTSLDFWLESFDLGAEARFWVRLPFIPVTGTTIYMRFGDPMAVGASDPRETMTYYDHFESDPFPDYSVIDCSGPNDGLGTISYSDANERLEVRCSDNHSVCLDREIVLGQGLHARVMYYKISDGWEGGSGHIQFMNEAGDYYSYNFSDSYYGGGGVRKRVNGVEQQNINGSYFDANGWYQFDTYMTPERMQMDINGTVRTTMEADDTTPIDVSRIYFRWRQCHVNFTSIEIRQYVEPEPVAEIEGTHPLEDVRLLWSSAGGFVDDGVDPDLGVPGTAFAFRVVYLNTGDLPPAEGYPRLLLDANADGDADDPGDWIVPLDAIDADEDYTDGREYLAQVVLELDQASYQYRFEAVDMEGAAALGEPTGWSAGPVVDSYLYDLAIYADDIQFSNPNPDVDEPFDVTVSFANNSVEPATNVKVVLHQEGGAALDSTIVAEVAPWTTADVQFTRSFDALGFYPLRARISSPDITEWNLLNNDAARPILVGDFAIPGAIAIESLPTTVTVHPLAYFAFGGRAVYHGTPIAPPPPVQGGTVVYRPSWGGEFLSHTNDAGTFGQYLQAPSAPGSYGVEVQVTDYTLSTTATVSVTVVVPPYVPPRADLRIAVSAAPTQLCEGGDVDVTWRVSNHGDLASTATTAVLTYDSTVLRDEPVPALEPGESVTLPSASVYSAVTGLHTVSGRVDPGNLVVERFEYNNTASVAVRAWPACAELDPDYLRGPASAVCVGGSASFSTAIYNWGCYDTQATEVAILIDGEEIARRDLGAIAGRNHHGAVGFTRTFDTVGSYVVTFRVDPDGLVSECQETNNDVSRTVSVVECITYPDLTIASCELRATNPEPTAGELIGFQAVVRNAASVPTADEVVVRFTLDDTPAWQSEHNLGVLAAGSEQVVTSQDWPVIFSPDRLRVTVDPEGQVAEANEGNNTATVVLPYELHPVHIPICPGYGTPMFSDCSPCPGDEITIRGAVVNDGLFSVDETEVSYAEAGMLISLPATLPVSNLRYLGQCVDDVHWTSITHSFAALGAHTVTFSVDPGNDWPEYNEENNVYSGSVSIYDCTQPDLYVWSQHINPAELNPDYNTTIDSVAVTVFNGGNEDALDVEVRLAVDEEQLGELATIGNVPGGSYRSVQWTDPWLVPEGLPAIHVFQACADPQNLIAESNEENNCATRSIVAGAAPDLFLESDQIVVSVDHEPADPGDPVHFAVPIMNRGGMAAAGLLVIETEDAITGLETLATLPVFVEAAGADYGRQWVNASWVVPAQDTWVHVSVVSVVPQEYDETNNHVQFRIPDDDFIPTQVGSFAASSTGAGVRLRWTAAGGLAGFHVEREATGRGDWVRVTATPVVASVAAGYHDYELMDAGVQAGQEYSYRLLGLDAGGRLFNLAFASIDHVGSLPTAVALSNNFPNPFNPQTDFKLSLPREQRVAVGIYDLAGRLVRRLVSGVLPAGVHSLTWRGETESGGRAASGIYFCRMQSEDRSQTVKLMMVK